MAALADGGSRCFVFRFAGVLRQLDWHVDNPIGRRRAPKTKGTRDNPICGCRGGSGFSSSVVAVGCSGCRHPDVGLSTVVWGVRGTSELARRCRYLSGLSTPIWRWRGRPGWWLLPGGSPSKRCESVPGSPGRSLSIFKIILPLIRTSPKIMSKAAVPVKKRPSCGTNSSHDGRLSYCRGRLS